MLLEPPDTLLLTQARATTNRVARTFAIAWQRCRQALHPPCECRPSIQLLRPLPMPSDQRQDDAKPQHGKDG